MTKTNFKARQSINNQYAKIKGASSINDVAVGFGKGWIVFAILSAMASAFSFYQDFTQSLGVVVTILLVVVLAVALEAFKHLSIKGMFSDMHLLSRSLVSVVALSLIAVSFYTHYKSIQTFQKNLVTTDLKDEISYQRDLQKVQNGQIASILATNTELAKALNNGTTHDDAESASSVQSNNRLIETLQKLSAQNNMHNTNLLLQESRNSAKTTASAILVIFIMIEIMALFSILSKIIIVDNVSNNVKEFFGIIDKLDELETNTYQALGYQQMEQTQAKIKAVQSHQEEVHQERLKEIETNHPTLPCTKQNNQVDLDKIAFNANLAQKPYLSVSTPNYLQNSYDVQKLPIKSEAKPQINSDASSSCNENLEQNEQPKKNDILILDLMKYNYQDSQIILASWDNGAIEEGGKLVKKTLVLAELEEHGIKEDDYVSLFRRLKRQRLVKFDMGYYSLCELHNIASTKSIG